MKGDIMTYEHIPNLFKKEDRESPDNWVGYHKVKWVANDGKKHKTFVTPIRHLSMGHLFDIICDYRNHSQIENEVLRNQVLTIYSAYNRRKIKL